jgi:hypothetical protein
MILRVSAAQAMSWMKGFSRFFTPSEEHWARRVNINEKVEPGRVYVFFVGQQNGHPQRTTLSVMDAIFAVAVASKLLKLGGSEAGHLYPSKGREMVRLRLWKNDGLDELGR